MAIESPCIKTCILDPLSGHCLGCGRTGEEIAGWIGYSDDERRRIMAGLDARMAIPTATATAGASSNRTRMQERSGGMAGGRR